MKESNLTLEERVNFLEYIVNKFAEEQVMMEDALKSMKKKLETASAPELDEICCKDAGGFSASEEV